MSESHASWVESAFDHPAFLDWKRQGAPALLAELHPFRLVWANAEMLALLSAASLEEIAGRIFDSHGASARTLADLGRGLEQNGAPRLGRLRLARGIVSRNHTILCRLVPGPAGACRLAVAFLERVPASRSAPDPHVAERTLVETPAEPVPAFQTAETETQVSRAAARSEPAAADGEGADPIERERTRLEAEFNGVGRWRFLWRTDPSGRLVQIDSAVFERLGSPLRPAVGQRLAECISAFDPHRAERLKTALANSRTWSGIEVLWPVAAEQMVVPVRLGASPQFDASRTFEGFRGFGMIEIGRLCALPGVLTEEPSRVAPASGEISDGGDLPSVNDAGSAASQAPEAAKPPAAVEQPGPRPSANVVRLWPHPAGAGLQAPARAPDPPSPEISPPQAADGGAEKGADHELGLSERTDPDPAGSLSSSEHLAFQEIALALGAKIEQSRLILQGQDSGEPEPTRRDASEPGEQDSGIDPRAQTHSLTDAIPSGFDAALLVENTPAMLAVVRDGIVLFANRALLDRLGFRSLAELSSARRVANPQDHPATPGESVVSLTGAGGEPIGFRGEPRRLEWDGGDATLWLLHPSDNAEAEPTVRSGRQEAGEVDDATGLRGLLDASGEAIAAIDEAGRILSLNRQGERWFGRDRRRLADESFTLLLAPESRAAAASLLAEVKAQQEVSAGSSRELTVRTPEGVAMPVLMSLAPMGEGLFAAVWRDLTAVKRLERELERAERESERATARQPDFLAKVSHEIRTPLNAILGFAEIMTDERFGPLGNARYRDYLQDIHASGTRIMNLINDLLDLSRIEAGRLDLHLGSVEINKVIGECVAEIQPQAHRERIIVRTSLGARLPPVVADERSVRQIVSNLLSNAVRFNEPGGQVIVSTTLSDKGGVVTRIRDTGVGMSDADIAAALEPLRQFAPPAKNAGGTGLGLPLTKALVGANGGSLSIRSRPQEGTLVEVTFMPANSPSARMPA